MRFANNWTQATHRLRLMYQLFTKGHLLNYEKPTREKVMQIIKKYHMRQIIALWQRWHLFGFQGETIVKYELEYIRQLPLVFCISFHKTGTR